MRVLASLRAQVLLSLLSVSVVSLATVSLTTGRQGVAALAMVGAIAVLLGVTLTYGLTRRLNRLVEAVRRIGAGELDYRLVVQGPTELAVLTSSVNRMADDLLHSRRELEAYSVCLERRVAERTAESERRRDAAEALAEVGRAVSQSLDPSTAGQRIAASVRVLLRTQRASLFRLDPSTHDLVLVAQAGAARPPLDVGAVFPVGTGIVGLAVRDRRPVATSDVVTDPRVVLPPDLRDRLENADFRAVLAVPLCVKDRIIGALTVTDRAGRTFTEDDTALVQAFADQAAIALENALLYHRIEERARRLATLSSLTQVVASASDSERVFHAIAEAANQILGARLAYVWVEDQADAILRPRARVAADPRILEIVTATGLTGIPRGAGVVGGVVTSRAAAFIEELESEPRWLSPHLIGAIGLHSGAVVPLLLGDDVVGVMAVFFAERREFADEDKELLYLLAGHAATAIRNARLLDDLRVRQGRLEELLEVTGELSKIQPLESLLERIAAGCGRVLGCDSVSFRLLEGEGDLVLAATTDSADGPTVPHRVTVGQSLSGVVATSGEPLAIDDVASEPRMAPDQRDEFLRSGRRAWCGVPLRAGGKVIGVLTARQAQPFSPHELVIATAFASQAATALENARLYREVEQAYTELSQTQAQLVQAQKIEAVGRLAGGIAHDFNNLLTVILGRGMLLQHQLAAAGPERRQVDIIQSTAKRAVDLTRQLLAFSRKQVLQPRPLDPNALLAGLAPILRRMIGEDIELEIESRVDAARVIADPVQVEQVVMNLVVNARDAMPRGGRVTIRTSNVEIDEAFVRLHPGANQGSHTLLSVIDNGCGMDEGTLAQVFEPFFTTKEPGKGTGLGLSTVYGIVKQHNGYIEVTSRPGAGTSVDVYLPSTVAKLQDGKVPVRPPSARGSETVLLVEDDTEVRTMVREFLEALGYRVLEARSGDEADHLARAHQGPIGLLLSDVVMPHVSGPELANRLRLVRGDMHVLFMSGYTDERLGAHGILSPDVPLIHKPFTQESLAAMLRRVLDAANGRSPEAARGI